MNFKTKRHFTTYRYAYAAGAFVLLSGVFYTTYTFTHEDVKATPVTVIALPVSTQPNPFLNMKLTAESAIVVDLGTGDTLFSQKPDEQLPLASLTKLLTLYAASTVLSPDAPITITDQALAQDGDNGLRAGEVFSFLDLARLTLVVSSNDGAEAIAEAVEAAQSSSPAQMLASAVASAGLSQTYALNGTGLDENLQTAGAYGTARDVAKLADGLLKRAPSVVAATTLSSLTVKNQAGFVHTVKNTNQDVIHMPDLLLSKTGYTDLAGGNLVVIFNIGPNHPIAIVVLGSTQNDRFTDVSRLTRATLAHFAYFSNSPQ
jgi:D-alanyl-D-alanine carboxypeptidase